MEGVRLAVDDLRGDVHGRATGVLQPVGLVFGLETGLCGESEVTELDMSVMVEQNILGLQISVKDLIENSWLKLEK